MNENNNNEVRLRERQAQQSATAQKLKKEVATGGTCKNCGAAVEEDMEICPRCGWKLVDYCTFCGAPMATGDMDCPECGMPADGVECPDCHIRNFRPFCRQCGQPLSRAARMAVEKAKKDPKVQETVRLLQRMADLKAELAAAEEGTPEDEESQQAKELPELEQQFRALMSKVGFKPAEQPKTTPKPKSTKSRRTREQILAEYKQAIQDTNRMLSEMLPPAGSTPQEQRNYYTARKVAVVELMAETWYGINPRAAMGWRCNRCQVLHDDPSQCSYKEFGGQWTDCKEWDVVDPNTKGAVKNVTYVEKCVYKR